MNRHPGGASDEETFLLFFQHLQADTANTLIDTYKEYLAQHISLAHLQQAFVTTLRGAHTQAAHIGRRMAGVTDPLHPADEAFAQTVMFEQARYLSGLIGDIRGGLDSQSEVIRRLRMYATRLLGTMNRTWAMAQPVGTMLKWVLHPAEHCQDCESRAAGGPYDAYTIPWVPGDGSSECTVNCKCTLEVV